MTQTVKGSLVEAITNTVVGFAINYTANLLILPQIGCHLTLLNNFEIGLLYTAIAVARSFGLRRLFNYIRFGNRKELQNVTHAPPSIV